MESGSIAAPMGDARDKGLKKNAIGYLSNVVIGVASTAPGYSIAATLGFVVAVEGVGLQAPAVMMLAFVSMFCVAYAYKYMNQADPDCGTSFSWVTKGLGPGTGWVAGWAIIVTDVIVMGSLAQIAAIYSFLLFRWDGAAESQIAVIIAGVIWIAVMTAICYLGTELSAATQRWLLGIEIFTLALFAIWALVKVYATDPAGGLRGPKLLIDNQDDVLSVLGKDVFGTPLDLLLIITVLTSASASTQTTILPTARTTLSMARHRAFPKRFGQIHPRYLTPSYSTLWMGTASTIWFVAIEIISPDNVLGDSVTALGFGIAFYYGITGFACVWFYRHELGKSARNLIYAGLLPLAGGLMLLAIFVKAFFFNLNPDNTYTAFFGVGAPVVIGVGALLAGVVVMVFARGVYTDFFSRKPEVFDPATAGDALVPEEAV